MIESCETPPNNLPRSNQLRLERRYEFFSGDDVHLMASLRARVALWPPIGYTMSDERGIVREGTRIEDVGPPILVANAEYVEHDVREKGAGKWSKVVRWGHLRVGDCGQEPGGTLILDSSGLATFECVTYTSSTHSGDHWWAAFLLQDKDKVTLHSEPFHKGPRMDDGHPAPRYRWSFTFGFDGAKLAQIEQVFYAFKC